MNVAAGAAARAQGLRRRRDLRHPRRFRAAVLQGGRGEPHPAAAHAEPRAGGGLRRRCGRAVPRHDRRGRGHLRRRRLQPGQRGLRRLRREVAGGRDLRRARPGREPLRPAAAPSGPHARHPVPGLPGDHLRPGAAGRPGHRAGRDRARAHRRHRPGPAGLSRAAARHGGRALRPGPGLRRAPRPTPTRSPPAPTRSWRGWPRPSGP